MKKLLVAVFLTVFVLNFSVHAQDGNITGKIIDENDAPVAYASVAVLDSVESSVVTGASSDSTGTFNIDVSPGKYVVKVTFISYENYTESVTVNSGQTVELGSIQLTPSSETLNEVVVRAEESQMEMSFDKRVFDVGQDITSLGGSALNVLDNVPSISMDIDGNISLRGNQSVRVLINGKPSSMVNGDVESLRSVPANMIKEIEIITNPSSKYAAEGSGGIINIILKKNTKLGFNGTASIGSGYPEEYEGSTNLNYRTENVNWFIGGGADYRSEPESGSSFQRFSGPDTTYMYRESTDANETELEGNLRFGADFYLSENEVLTASSYLSVEEEENFEDTGYTDLEYSPGAFDGNVLQRINRDNNETENEKNLDINLEYENKIEGEDHMLTADASFDISSEEASSSIEETLQQGSGDPLMQRTNDSEEEQDLRFNAEYVRPLGEDGKLEAGLRSDTEWMDTSYRAETLVNGTWVGEPAFNNNFLYRENVNAAYLILGNEFGDFSGQVGVRAENTRIRTEIKNTGDVNEQNYLNFFPSIFLNYSFNDQQSVQLSYSRRLSRPYSRNLLPFIDFADNRSQFTGNPDLRPEFSNSYEAGYLHYWNTGSLLTSFYYRYRTDVVEDITEQRQGVLYRFPINLATEKAWGIELSADQKIANALTLTGNANLFRANRNGSYQNQVFSSESENFQARMRVRWEFAENWNYQTSMRYRGPRETTQGRREGMTMVDMGLSKDVFNGKGLISLSIRDLLNSQNFNSTVRTDGNPNTDFFSRRQFSWSSRSFSINFQYFFGRENDQNSRN